MLALGNTKESLYNPVLMFALNMTVGSSNYPLRGKTRRAIKADERHSLREKKKRVCVTLFG